MISLKNVKLRWQAGGKWQARIYKRSLQNLATILVDGTRHRYDKVSSTCFARCSSTCTVQLFYLCDKAFVTECTMYVGGG